MKRSLAGLIVMSLGLIGIYVCVITKRPVDNIINICFLGGMRVCQVKCVSYFKIIR